MRGKWLCNLSLVCARGGGGGWLWGNVGVPQEEQTV